MNRLLMPSAMALTLATVAVPLLSSGCSTDAYCFDCETVTPNQDAGLEAAGGSGGTGTFDSGFGDTLQLDSNDCGADLDTDPLNCGWCGHVCEIANAFPICKDKFCVVDRCAAGYYDLDGQVANGCEYECEPLRDINGDPLPEESVCDGNDDDCDGLIDEGFDFDNSLEHCGGCNQVCTAPANSIMTCNAGTCEFDRCLDNFQDSNADLADGCECNLIGAEQCNFIDDDCDGEIDEGIDTTSDVDNCGACGNACGDIYPNASTTCTASTCVFGGCLNDYYDIDGELLNGCEYHCTLANPPTESCNGVDDDCNGFIDDGALPGVGDACGSAVGECEEGARQCVNGALACVGDKQPTTEVCDGLNNDCDGTGATGDVDEGCPTATAPNRLDVGGSAAGADSTTQLSVAGQGTHTFAAYLDRRSGNADIRLNVQSTVGGNWRNPDLVVAGTAANEVEPWVFASPTRVYVAYGLFVSGTVRRIQLASSTLTPTTWALGQAEKSAPAAADSFFVRGIVVGQSGPDDQVVLVWQVLNGTSRNIYLQASEDGGATWRTSDLRVNEVAGKAELPSIATDGQGLAYIAWRDARGAQPEVYVDVYDATSDTLAGNQRVSVGNPTKPPVIAADSTGNVHVAWTDLPDNAKKRIRVATSTNSGATFGASVIINTPAFADADTPDIIARGGKAVAAWDDNRSGLSDIYVNVWAAGAWRAAPSRADGGPRGAYRSTRPKVAFGGGNRIFVAYQEYRGAGASTLSDVYANFSLDDGVTFQPNDFRVDPGATGVGDSITPFVTAPGGGGAGNEPVIVWLDNLSGGAAAPNADVYAATLAFP